MTSQIGPRGMTAFVPNGDSRSETATLLLGAAADAGLPAQDIASSRARDGFYISDALADHLGGEQDPDGSADDGTDKQEEKS